MADMLNRPIPTEFKFRLREILEQKGIKQTELLERCKPMCEEYGVKITSGQLSEYLSGKSLPKQDKVYILAKALNVSEVYLMGWTDRKQEEQKINAFRIPVLGKVSAGIPIEAITDYDDWEEITEDMARRGTHIALTIHGTSMQPKMEEGDVVIVRLQNDVESGEIGLVYVGDNDATCKKVVKTDNGLWLKGLNDSFEPLYFRWEDVEQLPVRIAGKVVELRAKF